MEFTRASREYIDSLNEEMKENVEGAIQAMIDHMGVDDTKIKLEITPITDDQSELDLFVKDRGEHMAEINIPVGSDDITVNLDANYQARMELMQELSDNMKHFNEKMNEAHDDRSEALDLVKTPEKEKPENHKEQKVQNVSREDATRSVMDRINKTLADAGIKNDPYTKKQQEKVMSAIRKTERADKPNLFIVRREKLENIKNLEAEIENTYNDIRNAASIGYTQGGLTPEDEKAISDMSQLITKDTILAIKEREELPSVKEAVMQYCDNLKEDVKEKLGQFFDKIKVALEMKIEAGRNALNQIKDVLVRANERYAAEKDTAYTGVTEKVAQISRNYMAVAYSIDKAIANTYDKIHEICERSYEKQAEVKGALKDLGRALTGQERTGETADFTDRQRNVLEKLEEKSGIVKTNMATLEQSYEMSKTVSAYNLGAVQEHRQSVGLNPLKGLDAMLKEAESRHIEKRAAQTDRGDSQTKKEPSRDDGERSRF